MPVYRQRTSLPTCATATTSSLTCAWTAWRQAPRWPFPEGNHNPFPSLRPLKGGLAEMLARGAQARSLCDIQFIPIGLDTTNTTPIGDASYACAPSPFPTPIV